MDQREEHVERLRAAIAAWKAVPKSIGTFLGYFPSVQISPETCNDPTKLEKYRKELREQVLRELAPETQRAAHLKYEELFAQELRNRGIQED